MKRNEALVADKDQHQWFTPIWVAEELFNKHFADLSARDLVCEPTCGRGTFLQAIPAHIPAFGVEIDPVLADQARRETGRQVLTGDFRVIPLDLRPTVLMGNFPFDLEVIDGILDRAHKILPENGRVGTILPTYAFQTASRVSRYSESWSLMQEMIPRNIFPGMQKPLCWAIFTKDRRHAMVGFALYHELHEVTSMPDEASKALALAKAPWKSILQTVLAERGGEADLEDIYAAVAPRRPTENQWWKQKLRQTLNINPEIFIRVGHGRYALADGAVEHLRSVA